MCEKCVELDEKIEHYKVIQSRVTDPIVLTGIDELIAEMLAKKAELHTTTDE